MCQVASITSDSLRLYRMWLARLLCPYDSPGKNTGAGCHALLQGIFLAQGLNSRLLCLLPWQVGSLPVVPPGKPGNLNLHRLIYSPCFLLLFKMDLSLVIRPS